MKFLAIDPGAVHTGVARLLAKNRAGALVGDSFELTYLSLRELGAELEPYIKSADTVVVEDFDIRRSGFNAFNRGDTLRRLGMIEYLVRLHGKTFELIPPAAPSIALQLWPKISARSPLFRTSPHAMSAWRVLGQHLLNVGLTDVLRFYDGELST